MVEASSQMHSPFTRPASAISATTQSSAAVWTSWPARFACGSVTVRNGPAPVPASRSVRISGSDLESEQRYSRTTLKGDRIEVGDNGWHTEVEPRWHRRRPDPGRVIGLADRLGEVVEAALDQYQLQAVVKYMTWRCAASPTSSPSSPPADPGDWPHRHQRTPLSGQDTIESDHADFVQERLASTGW